MLGLRFLKRRVPIGYTLNYERITERDTNELLIYTMLIGQEAEIARKFDWTVTFVRHHHAAEAAQQQEQLSWGI